MTLNLRIKASVVVPITYFFSKRLFKNSIITKSKLFIICIDFEGAFDKISRNKLFTKLHMFGAGTTFLFCLMTIYMMTDYVIFGKDSNYSYHLYCGIKQGLPLSPFLFLFYINDLFDMFEAIHGRNGILETLHVLIHADDTTILASSRQSAERKISTLLSYCKNNFIKFQISKCEFIVINGEDNDRCDFILENGNIKHKKFITLLGTQLHESGKFNDNLELHMRNRYLAVHKFYNFLRTNKLAPIPVKLKVLRACVMSAMLHNCETFGKCSLKKLESLY